MSISKITNISRQLSNVASLSRTSLYDNGLSHISRMGISATLMAGLLLTGCSNNEKDVPVEEIADEQVVGEEETVQAANGNAVVAHGMGNEALDSDASQNADDAGEAPKPVSYDVQNWKGHDQQLTLNDQDDIKDLLGSVTATDKNSLDYVSSTATKYRFMEGEQPYLDLIDSKKYLEIGWYYANPRDSDSEKEMSIDHAKKVYAVATALMGDAGAQLVASILSGQIIKNKEINGVNVELAKCEFYSCMLIMQKDS